MHGAVLVVVVLAGVGALGHRAVAAPAQPVCVAFVSRGLTTGATYAAPIGHGLEFRLSSNWTISVGPGDSPDLDFLSIVSPPFRVAPHLQIAPGYGMTASEVVGIKRPLRFLLTRTDYDIARKAHGSEPAEQLLRTLDTLARGTIKFRIYAYQIRRTLPDGTPTDTFESISFEGEACVAPRTEGPPW